jgi:A/G-specific adenine glycosylase
MVKIPLKKINQVQEEILSFYFKNKRDLPWRKTQDPYKILLSEFMLQQTQVNRVIEYYNKWIERWPTIKDLSLASFQDVLSEWMGLGYNRRAPYLHNTSKIIVNNYNCGVLSAMQEYKKLPGIGKYTARAVRIFARNEDIATVDTNIRRILIHMFDLSRDISDNTLFEIAEACVPKNMSCIWHNALMDYGALYLTSRKTGIKPKSKQSIFEGSNRQIRGKILRLLIKECYDRKKLSDILDIEQNRLDNILNKMVQEMLISKQHDCYMIVNK